MKQHKLKQQEKMENNPDKKEKRLFITLLIIEIISIGISFHFVFNILKN